MRCGFVPALDAVAVRSAMFAFAIVVCRLRPPMRWPIPPMQPQCESGSTARCIGASNLLETSRQRLESPAAQWSLFQRSAVDPLLGFAESGQGVLRNPS
jgi:hypothetical protein